MQAMNDGVGTAEGLFGLVVGALWMAPPLGILVGWKVRSESAGRVYGVYSAVSATLVVAAVVSLSPWSFRGVIADAWVIAAAYCAYCVGAVTVPAYIRPVALRKAVGLVSAAPVAIGYLAGTIGVLGVGFVVSESVPTSVAGLSPGLSYRTYTFGNVTTSSGGTVVEVYSHPGAAPFLERRVFRAAYDFREHDLTKLTVGLEHEHGTAFVAVREAGRLLKRIAV